jgi:hypothetical protein
MKLIFSILHFNLTLSSWNFEGTIYKRRYLRAQSVQFFFIHGESKFVIICKSSNRVQAFYQLLSLVTVLGRHYTPHWNKREADKPLYG